MTSDALHENVLLVYSATLLGLLLVAGAVLAGLVLAGKKNLRPVWLTYASWWVLGPVTFGAIYLGRIPTILLFTLMAVLAFKEFARATGLYRDWWTTGTVYLLILSASVAAMIRDPHSDLPGWFGLYMMLTVVALVALALVPILRNRTQGQLQVLALALLGFMCIGWMFLHVALLADLPNATGCLLYLLLAVELNDVAAFIFGRLLGRPGKHLLRSQISPNKTWEGALGALAVSLALPWLLHFSFPHFGTMQLLLAGLIVGVGGPLGDLSISLLKRDLGVKDMGTLIPGHGGVLDRIDSLIYTAPLFLHMLRFFGGNA